MAFDAMPYHFFERKMKKNKNINKNTHHKSYIKVIIVKFTQDTRKVFPFTMVVTDTWKTFGWNTIVYLAAITGISPALYEAAALDGAGRFRQILHVAIPGILPIVLLMTVLSIGNVLRAGFDQIFNLYSPLVYSTGDIIDTFVYRMGILGAQFGPATAVGLFQSVVSCVLIVAGYWAAEKFAGYQVF